MTDNKIDQDSSDIDAKPIPRDRCTSVINMLERLSAQSDGRISVSEFADALTSHSVGAYDAETMMLYSGSTGRLAEPIQFSDLESGRAGREGILVELYNVRVWDDPDAMLRSNGVETDPRE